MSFRLPEDWYMLSELAELLDQRDYSSGYLDPATGIVYREYYGEVLGDDGEPVDFDEVDWIALGGEWPHEPYHDMERFASAVADPSLSARLLEALDGRGAFRRFKRVVYNTPDEIGKVWNRYREASSELRALAWLVDRGLVDEAETQQLVAEREQAAKDALQEVSAGPQGIGPRLLLLNGMPGVGKSTLAAELAARQAGTLNLDLDVVRSLIGGDPASTAEPARFLGLAMAEAHLRSGCDVVVPQLVAQRNQVDRFAAAATAAGASFDHVLLEREGHTVADAPHRSDLDERRVAQYRDGLASIADSGVARVAIVEDDVPATVTAIEDTLDW